MAGSDCDELTGYRRSGLTRSFLPQAKGASLQVAQAFGHALGRRRYLDLQTARDIVEKGAWLVGHESLVGLTTRHSAASTRPSAARKGDRPLQCHVRPRSCCDEVRPLAATPREPPGEGVIRSVSSD